MALTITQICNSALIKLGAEPIVNITDQNKRAILCNNQYQIVKDKLLRSHPWNFAIVRVELDNDGLDPVYGFTYQFDLPTDLLRILDLEDKTIKFKIEGRKILSDEETLKIRYVASVSESLFDSVFNETLSLALAAEISFALNQSSELTSKLKEELADMLRPARSFNAQEGTPQELEADDWLNERL